MSRHSHHGPFGAEPTASGVRFRLWAPAAAAVELLLYDSGERSLAMAALPGGWFELETAAAGTGSRYAFRIDGGATAVPDPASRFQPEDVHRASEVIDPDLFEWQDDDWRGRPWEEAVFYELHVGSFTPEGNYAGVIDRLDHLVSLGVTAIELMPIADFPGRRNWGYDGVLPFAPDARYGRPEELKRLVQAAHARGLMVFLDVVYNHFGPEGNYLHLYAPAFFTDRHSTPWGAAINYDGALSESVRRFFIENALYWLTEYRCDGLRLDAVHAICDDSRPDIIEAIADAVHTHITGRTVHLVLENDCNRARYLARDGSGRPRHYAAQWNDDIHHCLHLLATGEHGGYYEDYAARPLDLLGRCLAEGFAWQGEASAYRHGRPRGEPSAHLPPTAFVSFLQNHDQIGNRAFGERIHTIAPADRLRFATELLLLTPQVPLLFMGQEWMADSPFLFFCDFGPELARAVTEGRRREFARFPEFSDERARARIPDPERPATFLESCLRWEELTEARAQKWLTLHRDLLTIRRREIVPLLPRIIGARQAAIAPHALGVTWALADGTQLQLLANVGDQPLEVPRQSGRLIYASGTLTDILPPWSLCFALDGKAIA